MTFWHQIAAWVISPFVAIAGLFSTHAPTYPPSAAAVAPAVESIASTTSAPLGTSQPAPEEEPAFKTKGAEQEKAQITCGGKSFSPCTGDGTPVCLDDGSNAYCKPQNYVPPRQVNPAEEDFSSVTAKAIQDYINSQEQAKQIVVQYRNIAQERANRLSNLISSNESLAIQAPDEHSRQIVTGIVKLYQIDLDYTQKQINMFSVVLDYIDTKVIPPWQNSLNQINSGTKVNRQQFVAIIESLMQWMDKDALTQMGSTIEKYNDFVSNADSNYNDIFNRVQSLTNPASFTNRPAPRAEYLTPHSLFCSSSEGFGTTYTSCSIR